MTNKQLIHKKYSLTLIEEHIICSKINDFAVLELEDFMVIEKWIKENINETKIYNLLQFGNGSSVSRELREYSTSQQGSQLSSGTAVIVKNFAQQLIVDFYLKFNHPTLPTQAFHKKEKAIKWLKSLNSS
jgi:hypothetical protein